MDENVAEKTETKFTDAYEAARAWRDAGISQEEIARRLHAPLPEGGWNLRAEEVSLVLYDPEGLDLSREQTAWVLYRIELLHPTTEQLVHVLRERLGLIGARK